MTTRSGFVSFTGSSTTASVMLSPPEGNDTYQVVGYGSTLGGSPPSAALQAWIVNPKSEGFTIVIGAPPGAGNTVRVDWVINDSSLVTPPNIPPENTIAYATDYGVKTDGTDCTEALNNIAANVPGVVIFPRGVIRFSDTILFQEKLCKTWIGAGTSGGALGLAQGTTFEWRGSNDRPMFELRDSRSCSFRDFRIYMANTFDALEGFRVWRSGLVVGQVSTKHEFINLDIIGDANLVKVGIGFRLGGPGLFDANNEDHLFDRVTVACCETAGWSIEHSQARNHEMRFCYVQGRGLAQLCAVGVNTSAGAGAQGGGFTWKDGGMTAVETCFLYGNHTGSFEVSGFYAENVSQLIKDVSTSAAASPRTFVACTIESATLTPVDGKVVNLARPGPTVFKGCAFLGYESKAVTYSYGGSSLTPAASVSFEECHITSSLADPFLCNAPITSFRVRGCTYNRSGTQSNLPAIDTESGLYGRSQTNTIGSGVTNIAWGTAGQPTTDFIINNEGGAATDDLDRILPTAASGLQAVEGTTITIRGRTGFGQTCTVKHDTGTGAGKLNLVGGADFVMTSGANWMRLRYNATTTQWDEQYRTQGGASTISDEAIDDRVASLIVAGTNISSTYNDGANTLTIATSATVNQTDAFLLDRVNHTGTQLASTISDFASAVATNVPTLLQTYETLEDFYSATTPFAAGLVTQQTGTGATLAALASVNNTDNGLVNFPTGTTATGRCGVGTGVAILTFGTGARTFKTAVRLSAVSDGTDTYTVRAGFLDSFSAESTDGIFFRYTHSVNSGNWQFVARLNNVETGSVVNTSVAPVTTTTLQSLEVRVNAAGTSAEGFIDGVSIGTVTTNIPTTAARATGYGLFILKSLGTTSRIMTCDYVYSSYTPTVVR